MELHFNNKVELSESQNLYQNQSLKTILHQRVLRLLFLK
jgi:hypothetical protein